MSLDPELSLFDVFTLPDFSDIDGARQWERSLARQAPPVTIPDSLEVSDMTATVGDSRSVPVRLYRPAVDSPTPGLLYFHGGSFVMGGLDTDHRFCIYYAVNAGITVISVDYRLAPENPFPAGVEDCYGALCWVAEEAGRLGIDARRLGVAGSSAGGTLAAAVAIMARDRNGPDLALQMLVYPALDDRMDTVSINDQGRDYGVTRDVVGHMWRHYLGGPGIATSTYAAPARLTDCSRLAPAYIDVGALDPLRDEAMDYASRLLRAGTDVDLHVFAGAPHAFDMVEGAAVTARASRLRAAALRKAFSC